MKYIFITVLKFQNRLVSLFFITLLYCVSQQQNSQWDLLKTPGVWRAWAQFRGLAIEQSMIPQKETYYFHYSELLGFGSFIFLILTQCVTQLVSFLKLDLTLNDSSFTRNVPYTTETMAASAINNIK